MKCPLSPLLFAVAASLAPSVALAGRPGAPTDLRCEYEANPLGLDVRSPRLSWRVSDTRRGAVQSAYEIVVASSVEGLANPASAAWLTGKVSSSRSVHVAYRGQALEARQRYYWRVRTWDADDAASPWSEPAWWEMGLLDGDWEAQWIGRPRKEQGLVMGAWIWDAEAGTSDRPILARRQFTLPDAGIESAMLRVTADNEVSAYVNGRHLGDHDAWQSLAEYDLAGVLKPGVNVVAARATNEANSPCGLTVGIRVVLENGGEVTVATGPDWRTTTEEAEGWTGVGFDDSAWRKAEVRGEYGAQPWGRHGVGERGHQRPIRLRKEFSLGQPVAQARAYVTGLGVYLLRINGQRVGEDLLTPGWTHYDKRIQYQTYDVTDLLARGRNAIGAELGNGWWSGRINWRTPPAGVSSALRLLLQLEVTLADGSTHRVVTDDSWAVTDAPTLFDDLYDGESYDARLEQEGWDQPRFTGAGWEKASVISEPLGRLVSQQCPTMRITEELPTRTLTNPRPGVYVYDFGQNASGKVRLRAFGHRGAKLTIRHAEVLNPDGTIYTDNYRSAKCTDTYIMDGGRDEIWEPRFVYRGFRYAELTGYPGVPEESTLTALVFHTAAPLNSEFECSDPLINQVQRNIVWGQRSNLHSVPTDCPQRDERLGWTGDALVFARTSLWNMDLARFYAKWMHDITDSQGPGGEVSDVAPIANPYGPASPGWGDVIAVLPWDVYTFTGDTRILEDNYTAIKSWVDYMQAQSRDGLYEREGYSDWVAVVGSPRKPIGTAYYYLSTRLLSQMAQVLGRRFDAEKYSSLADDIAEAYNTAYYDPVKRTYEGATQTANILPLAFGITPEDQVDVVATRLVGDIVARNMHLSTGFQGTSYLMPTLSDTGHQRVATVLAKQRTYPSWGYMVDKGATTIWELWNSDTQGPRMNSRNHYAFGSVGRWYFETLAGINPDPLAPGFRRTIIKPQPAGDLTWARGRFDSIHGTIATDWRIEDGRFTLNLRIPANTEALVHVPTFGHADATVLEGRRLACVEGRAPQQPVEGVTIIACDGQAAQFRVGAGEYRFSVAR